MRHNACYYGGRAEYSAKKRESEAEYNPLQALFFVPEFMGQRVCFIGDGVKVFCAKPESIFNFSWVRVASS